MNIESIGSNVKTLENRIAELERDILRLQEGTINLPFNTNNDYVVAGATVSYSITCHCNIEIHRLAIAEPCLEIFSIYELRIGNMIVIEEGLSSEAYKSPGARIVGNLQLMIGQSIKISVTNMSATAMRFDGWIGAIPLGSFRLEHWGIRSSPDISRKTPFGSFRLRRIISV
jgi:hypothetical protein